MRRTSKGASARKGSLTYKGVRARTVKEKDPQLRGRIAVTRGTGVVEFPDAEQFDRIAKQEKIPRELVDKAFGHMRRPKPKRRTSRKKRSRKNQPSALARLLGLTPNAKKKSVRRDTVFVPTTRDGEPLTLSARTVLIPEAEVPRFGADRGVYMDMGGQVLVAPYSQAIRIAERWLTKKEFFKAFGHLKGSGVLGKTPKGRIPTAYGPRSMKLGHRNPAGEGPPLPGIVKGQLVLYHRPTGSIVWQAYDDEANFPDKPVWIWFGGKKKHVDFPKAMEGAKVGSGDRAEYVGAVDRGIPPMAMLTAFDYLLKPEQRAAAYRLFAGG